LDECLNLSTLLNDDLKSPINISSDITQRESPIQIVDEDDAVAFSIRVDVPSLGISVIDNVHPKRHGREILLGNLETICFSFSQTREGYHEIEAHLMSMQVDNHVMKSVHPVLVSSEDVTNSIRFPCQFSLIRFQKGVLPSNSRKRTASSRVSCEAFAASQQYFCFPVRSYSSFGS
jgi:hypothetical protein